tara:strand:- start:13266 stop:13496 length:231 start_codon:yes stop_codon:yes gene_type:complete
MDDKKEISFIEALKILTPREVEILELIGKGYSSIEISEELFLSTNTIYKHVERIKKKLSLKGSKCILKWYLKNSLP